MKVIDKKTWKIRRCANPIDYQAGHSRVVLCIHGFTGYPGEMAYPAKRLSVAGWDVRVPRITGHGTCGEDFCRTGVPDWRRQITDEWMNLSSRYDEVGVLGHSMGGLLSLDLAINYPVSGIAVMAPAIGFRKPGLSFLKLISLFVERRPFLWEPDPAYSFFDDRDDDDDEYLGSEYWSWTWFKPLVSLMKLQSETERRLKGISAPVLAIFGENDTIIGNNGREVLESGLNSAFKGIELPGCGHYIPYDPNPGSKEAAMDAVIEWFEG
ncbi:MAG: alpha/beta fold hydrolase [Spirochaetaceae bacterium]|nr:alpha/beta fold hydrolase [Spirochaetaceae bacterium]